MEAQLSSSFVQQSQAASQVILGQFVFIQGLKKLGSLVLTYSILILFSPLILIVGIYLWFLVRHARIKLTKAIHTNIEITLYTYPKLKQEHAQLLNLKLKISTMGLPKLETMDKIIIRFFQVRAFIDIFESRIKALENVIKSLNPSTTSKDDILVPISESELWNNRTKAYDYLV